MMPTWTYFVKWLIPVIVFTLSFLLLDLVITTSDPVALNFTQGLGVLRSV